MILDGYGAQQNNKFYELLLYYSRNSFFPFLLCLLLLTTFSSFYARPLVYVEPVASYFFVFLTFAYLSVFHVFA